MKNMINWFEIPVTDFDRAKKFYETVMEIQLHDAKITTIGSRAEDMFYITDQQSQPIINADRKAMIRNRILEMLAEAA